MTSLTHISLFSGIGGFELAMAEAGIPTLAACEIDKKARGVLHDRFPGVHIYHDVRKVTGDSLRALGAIPGRTVLSAGWPCQGNSVAGSRGGMADARSGLWSEVVRILAELRPAWFVGENVPGLLSVNGGADFATVIGDLAQLGYGFAWRILDAQHFGVPQRRHRVVIVGRLGDSGRAPAQVLLEPEGGGWNPAEGITPRPIFARRTAPGAALSRIARTLTASRGMRFDPNEQEFVVDIANALDTAQGGPDDNTAQAGHLVAFALRGRDGGAMPEVGGDGSHVGALRAATGGSSRDYISDGETVVRRLTPLETCRLQGYPDGHTATSDGKPQADSAQYKQHGNGIAVPVFAWVAKRLAAVDGEPA